MKKLFLLAYILIVASSFNIFAKGYRCTCQKYESSLYPSGPGHLMRNPKNKDDAIEKCKAYCGKDKGIVSYERDFSLSDD